MTIVHWSFVVKKMPAGSFEAKCLAIMDEVQAKHEGWSSRSAASRWQSSSQLVPRRARFTISWQARAFSRETSFPQRFRLEHPAAASFRRRSWASLGCDLPPHDKTVGVTRCGRICLGKRKINFSKVSAGQAVGSKKCTTISGR
jgi:hypothetical protein